MRARLQDCGIAGFLDCRIARCERDCRIAGLPDCEDCRIARTAGLRIAVKHPRFTKIRWNVVEKPHDAKTQRAKRQMTYPSQHLLFYRSSCRISCHIALHHISCCLVTSYRIDSHHMTSCRIASHRMEFTPITCWDGMAWHGITSHPIASHGITHRITWRTINRSSL